MQNNINKNLKQTIPIFFAVDDRYTPYLAVSIRSLIDNASKNFNYKIYILIDSLSLENCKNLEAMQNSYVSIEFVCVKQKLDSISSKLHLRDYYTKATYYRFFIPSLFPQYDRGIYLDCDIVVLGDISELYLMDLGNNYVAAAQEEVMDKVPIFGQYVESVLEIPCQKYFSAGVMVMNLDALRRSDVESAFVRVLSWRQFRVTQDQDYLNVLCNGKVAYLSTEWNKTAFPDADSKRPQLIHYKINWKPWHYSGTKYEEFFWQYAAKTPYLNMLLAMREDYSQAQKDSDYQEYINLMKLAQSEIDSDFDSVFSPMDFMLK